MATPTGRDLDALIEEATVDCYDEAEQVAGFFACLEDELELPFTTRLFGVDVLVEQIELTEHDDIVAVCRRDNDKAAIRLVDLPLPTPLPKGAQWIAAWKKWQTGS
jgi:hypothetical protein